EISGIHAGTLGIYAKTELAGLAGVVAGMAASIAMASAAYAQAKQGFEGSAKWSAIYTGVSYMFTAIFLALPYFLTRSMVTALGVSLVVGVTLVAAMTYYDTVISARKFKRQFGEIAGIILAASFVLHRRRVITSNCYNEIIQPRRFCQHREEPLVNLLNPLLLQIEQSIVPWFIGTLQVNIDKTKSADGIKHKLCPLAIIVKACPRL